MENKCSDARTYRHYGMSSCTGRPVYCACCMEVHHSIVVGGWGALGRGDGALGEDWLNGTWNVKDNGINQPSNWQELLYCMYQINPPNASLDAACSGSRW